MCTYYSSNVSFYENPEVDRLLLQARRSVDPDRRRDHNYRVQEALHEDVPVVHLAYVRPPVGLQEQVEGRRARTPGPIPHR